jgi:hypothetical protein
MSLDGTYSGLQASVADWLTGRTDLVGVIPDFIRLAEAKFNREIRAQEMVIRKTTTSAAEVVGLPADWLQTKNVELITSNGPKKLEYVTLDHADDINYARTGLPTYAFTIVGGAIQLVPAPTENQTVQLTYYQKIPALTDIAPTNWLLTKHPDLYLYGALLHAAPYLENDERVQLWGTAVQATIDTLNGVADRAEFSGQPLRMKTRSFG